MSEEKGGSKVWEKNATSTKLIIIGVLALLLLIPATMIRGLIDEREARNASVTQEIGSKWGLAQPVEKGLTSPRALSGDPGISSLDSR